MSAEGFVIVGGGLAAARAIEAIRAAGHPGPITLVSNESTLPYDRPPLSKAVLAGTAEPETALLHPLEWYRERQVDLRLGVQAQRLQAKDHLLTLADDSELSWRRLLLATGSSARRLAVPGADLAHVLYLRSMENSLTLRDRLRSGAPLVVIGAGWIGLEAAAAARAHGCEVTVIEPAPTPLHAVVGARVGQHFLDLHVTHGVEFRMGVGVERLLGDEAGSVAGVITSTGEQLAAGTVLVGVGITPNTSLAEEAGLTVDDGIVCDQSLRTSEPDVFAAGDVANWFNPALQQHLRVDHWANAHHGGFAAGLAMVGQEVAHDRLPYFFSDQYDTGLEYTGYVPRGASTEVVVRGNPEEGSFMALWLSEGRVLAGMHVNMWDTIDDVTALIASRRRVDPDRLANPHHPLLPDGR